METTYIVKSAMQINFVWLKVRVIWTPRANKSAIRDASHTLNRRASFRSEMDQTSTPSSLRKAYPFPSPAGPTVTTCQPVSDQYGNQFLDKASTPETNQ